MSKRDQSNKHQMKQLPLFNIHIQFSNFKENEVVLKCARFVPIIVSNSKKWGTYSKKMGHRFFCFVFLFAYFYLKKSCTD